MLKFGPHREGSKDEAGMEDDPTVEFLKDRGCEIDGTQLDEGLRPRVADRDNFFRIGTELREEGVEVLNHIIRHVRLDSPDVKNS